MFVLCAVFGPVRPYDCVKLRFTDTAQVVDAIAEFMPSIMHILLYTTEYSVDYAQDC